ncbi:MAG: hypothetical protein HRT88_13275, partial [Lentisphaeraceae bacterium]|nr:hypothetical protein [Lentisphaeraceae bacterium]
MKTLISLFCLIALTSCQSTSWSLKKIKTVEGFDAPEAMLYDAKSDTVFISNIETSTGGWWADDKKAFISTMTADGQVKEMRWLNSSKKHPLHALKGMTILDGY